MECTAKYHTTVFFLFWNECGLTIDWNRITGSLQSVSVSPNDSFVKALLSFPGLINIGHSLPFSLSRNKSTLILLSCPSGEKATFVQTGNG